MGGAVAVAVVLLRQRMTAPHERILALPPLRETFLALVLDDSFLRRVLLYALNHRVQDFPDPLTTTLVLMATSPIQCHFCETGLLLFKTHLLPVVPFGLLRREELARLRALIEPLVASELHESIESNGQFTLQLLPFSSAGGARGRALTPTLCSRKLLLVFVDALLSQTSATPVDVNRTLCNIVLQRFLSRVSTPSEVVNAVMARIRAAPAKRARVTLGEEATAHRATRPKDGHSPSSKAPAEDI